jgi:serine/threonine protein kinase
MHSKDPTEDLPGEQNSRPVGRSLKSMGRYQLRWVLGRGGEATVYEGFDPDLARRVAVKVYEAVDERRAGNLMRAARLAGQCWHPNIVATLDLVREAGAFGLVQEFLAGNDLDSAELPTPASRLEVMQTVSLAMAHAHSRGVAHRDLKYSNVFRCSDGATKVLDFGLARDFSPVSTVPLMDSGAAGTPLYMAPEVYLGAAPTLASDLWSFGVMSFRLLTDEYPFPGDSHFALVKAICEAPLPRLSGRSPTGVWAPLAETDIFERTAAVVDGCLNRVPELRPSFVDLCSGLAAISRECIRERSA